MVTWAVIDAAQQHIQVHSNKLKPREQSQFMAKHNKGLWHSYYCDQKSVINEHLADLFIVSEHNYVWHFNERIWSLFLFLFLYLMCV